VRPKALTQRDEAGGCRMMRVISAEYVTITEWGDRAGRGIFSLKKD
jgi:hypothetical protein